MYKYFGIDINNQKINDSEVPNSLKELLEKNPELWDKITDIKFEDGTTIHQKNGKFENDKPPSETKTNTYDGLFKSYAVKINDKPKNEDDAYYNTSLSFVKGKLDSQKSDKIKKLYLPAIILQNEDKLKSVLGMSFFWYEEGKRTINSNKNRYPYSIIQCYTDKKQRCISNIVYYKRERNPFYCHDTKDEEIYYNPYCIIDFNGGYYIEWFLQFMEKVGIVGNSCINKYIKYKKLYNNNGYIIENYNSDKKQIEYFNNDEKHHRIDGPAIYEQDDIRDYDFNLKYYINGTELNLSNYKEHLKNYELFEIKKKCKNIGYDFDKYNKVSNLNKKLIEENKILTMKIDNLYNIIEATDNNDECNNDNNDECNNDNNDECNNDDNNDDNKTSPSCSTTSSPSCSTTSSPSCSTTSTPSCSTTSTPSCSTTSTPSCSPTFSPSCSPTSTHQCENDDDLILIVI